MAQVPTCAFFLINFYSFHFLWTTFQNRINAVRSPLLKISKRLAGIKSAQGYIELFAQICYVMQSLVRTYASATFSREED